MNMKLVASSQWAAVLSLPASANVSFKLVANNSWSAANWGESNQSDFTVPLSQIAESGFTGANIVLSNLQAGVYTFRFNEGSLAYQVDDASTVDCDGDGMTDAWETYFGLDPLNAGDRHQDTDGDRVSNLEEYIASTRPVDDEGYLAIASHVRSSGTGTEIRWTGVTGVAYRVLFSTNLVGTPAFSVLPSFTNVTGAGELTVTDTNANPSAAYRVEAWRAP